MKNRNWFRKLWIRVKWSATRPMTKEQEEHALLCFSNAKRCPHCNEIIYEHSGFGGPG